MLNAESPRPETIRDPHHVGHLAHPVHPHDVRAAEHAGGNGRGGAPSRDPAAGRSPVADVRNDFLEGPTRIGRSSAASRSSPASDSHVCSARLAKPKPGVDDHRSRGMPAATARPIAASSSATISPTTSSIDGLAIHVARPPAVVHQDDRRARGGDDRRQPVVVLQAADVVDDRRAPRDRLDAPPRPCRCRSTPARDDPGRALRPPAGRAAAPRRPDRLRAGTRGLSADVEDVGAVARSSGGRRRQRAPCPSRSPPSANESGVTLMMPMISVRSPRSSGARPGSGIE